MRFKKSLQRGFEYACMNKRGCNVFSVFLMMESASKDAEKDAPSKVIFDSTAALIDHYTAYSPLNTKYYRLQDEEFIVQGS